MQLPKTYRKLVATRKSPIFREVATIVRTEPTRPGPSQILVRNQFAAVNAADVNIAQGLYFGDRPAPFDLGGEVVGEVVAVGEGVTHLQPGQPVFVLGVGGGYSEYQTVDASTAMPIPAATPEALATLLSGLTAKMSLTLVGEMKSGETVLVTAAAGATGHFAVQLAMAAGNHVIGTCSTSEKAAMLRDMGCHRVVDLSREKLDDVLSKEYPKGVDLVYETVGKELFDVCVRHLAVHGRLLTLGHTSEYLTGPQPYAEPTARLYHTLVWRSASIRGFFIFNFFDHVPRFLGEMAELMNNGRIRATIDPTEFRGLESVAAAVDHLYSGKSRGKIVVRL